MKQTSVNALVDVAAFICFVGLLSTGLLIHFRLSPGMGRGSEILGLSRHEWGDIHFWFGIAMLVTISLHLFLHWPWIRSIAIGKMSSRGGSQTNSRLPIVVASLAVILAAAILPYLAPIKHTEGFGGMGQHRGEGRGSLE